MHAWRNTNRKNLLSLLNSGSGLPNLGTGYQGAIPGGGNPYGQAPVQGSFYGQTPPGSYGGVPSAYGPQGYPPSGFPQQVYGPPYPQPGYGLNPLGAGLIGLGLGFLGGQIINGPFKGPYKRYYYYL
ncbi:hypothetical protein FGG79_04220 [Bacillus sp. BHET2]|uniref:hypothetical protein n=1 Tax=Bacillus sp. BHET2 TaxID=2583818 RepID=UPI00110F3B5D|nr:hypothetical protein [Bacillus sp. BHET2]TMU87341.1 hypothetical protein FGG79_04220 [Bacillus sp. BHET2]